MSEMNADGAFLGREARPENFYEGSAYSKLSCFASCLEKREKICNCDRFALLLSFVTPFILHTYFRHVKYIILLI